MICSKVNSVFEQVLHQLKNPDEKAGTRDCRHSSQREKGCDEVEGCRKARIGLIVTCGDASELLEALEAVFNKVPPLVHLGIVGDERLSIGL